MNKVFFILSVILLTTKCFAAVDNEDLPAAGGVRVADRNAYDLTPEQETYYVNGTVDYMQRLNGTCREMQPHEMSFRLPNQFEIESDPVSPEFKMNVIMQEGVSFSAALNSLVAQPTEDRWIIDCSLAANLTQLQGMRCVLNNDKVFDTVCTKLYQPRTSMRSSLRGPCFFDQLDQSAKGPVVGGACFINQISKENEVMFTYNKGLYDDLLLPWPISSFYSYKHPCGNCLSLNMLITSMEDGLPHCIAFGYPQPMTFAEVVGKFMDAMDEPMTPSDIQYRQDDLKTVIGSPNNSVSPQVLQEVREDLLASIQSMKYDREKTRKIKQEIAKKATYSIPDFSKIFALSSLLLP